MAVPAAKYSASSKPVYMNLNIKSFKLSATICKSGLLKLSSCILKLLKAQQPFLFQSFPVFMKKIRNVSELGEVLKVDVLQQMNLIIIQAFMTILLKKPF
jgi:hypothetical protein